MDKGRIIQDDIPKELQQKHSTALESLALQLKKSQEAEEMKKIELEKKKNEEVKKHEDDLEIKLEEEEVTDDSNKK